MYLHTLHSDLHIVDIQADFTNNKNKWCYFICQHLDIFFCYLLCKAYFELEVNNQFFSPETLWRNIVAAITSAIQLKKK